jgi:hypothetical protein
MKELLAFSLILSQIAFGQGKSTKQSLLADSSVNLYAFVGEKIAVVKYDPNNAADPNVPNIVDTVIGNSNVKRSFLVLGHHFYATYKVMVNVFNDLKEDTVRFKTFDDQERPAFEKHRTVLLYIYKGDYVQSFYQQKGQFDELFKNDKGQWVGKNGESLEQLFDAKKKSVFKERGLFK